MNKFFGGFSGSLAVFLVGVIAVFTLAACGGGLTLRMASQAGAGENEPVEGADVTLTNTETGEVEDETTTDANGEYEFEDVPADETFEVGVTVELEDDLDR